MKNQKEPTKINTDLEIPSKLRRISAFLLDVFFTITIVGCIINLIFILLQKESLWNIITWIKTLNNDESKITNKQRIIRYSLIFPTSISLSFFIYIFMIILCIPIWIIDAFSNYNNWGSGLTEDFFWICWILILILIVTILIINIIEIFQICPTFIDKRLWIKRLYKKSK